MLIRALISTRIKIRPYKNLDPEPKIHVYSSLFILKNYIFKVLKKYIWNYSMNFINRFKMKSLVLDVQDGPGSGSATLVWGVLKTDSLHGLTPSRPLKYTTRFDAYFIFLNVTLDLWIWYIRPTRNGIFWFFCNIWVKLIFALVILNR